MPRLKTKQILEKLRLRRPWQKTHENEQQKELRPNVLSFSSFVEYTITGT